jgi:hypothetical protein
MRFLLDNAAGLGLVLIFSAWAGGASADVSGTIQCAAKAVGEIRLSGDQAVELCRNGGNAETALCAGYAVGEIRLSGDQAVALCRNAGTRSNSNCAGVAIGDIRLSRDQAVALCANRVWPEQP